MFALIGLLIGIALLLLGRKLFWLFVGGIGFALGFTIASQVFKSSPELIAVIIGLFFGLLGAWLARSIQRLAIALAGLASGGYLTYALLELIKLEKGLSFWILVIAGAVLGVILIAAIFEWALIFLSSAVGSALIIQALQLKLAASPLVFLILMVIGVLVQTNLFRPRRPRMTRPSNY